MDKEYSAIIDLALLSCTVTMLIIATALSIGKTEPWNIDRLKIIPAILAAWFYIGRETYRLFKRAR